MYDITIQFNNRPCYFDELQKYLNAINFKAYNKNDVLTYFKVSAYAQVDYSFLIVEIKHNEETAYLEVV